MFYILSKVLFFLLIPAWWIVGLWVWRRFSKSPQIKRVLTGMLLFILTLFTNPFFYNSMVLFWQPTPTALPSGKSYEAAVLLGGMSFYDKFDKGYFGNNADRFIQTANLYHEGIIKKIIVSGGTSNIIQKAPPEASFLFSELIRNGIPKKDIIIENSSRNTFENGVYSKTILVSLQLKPPFVLITSALHMRRSVQVFNKTGYSFVPYPCDYKVVSFKSNFVDYIVPDFSLLIDWSYFIKEIVGLYVYKLTGKA